MRGNFGLKLQNSPKLPHIHARLHEKGYSVVTIVPQRVHTLQTQTGLLEAHFLSIFKTIQRKKNQTYKNKNPGVLPSFCIMLYHFVSFCIRIPNNNNNGFVLLEEKDYVKFWGVLIDMNLTWRPHIDCIASKISKIVVILARLRHHVPLKTRLHDRGKMARVR